MTELFTEMNWLAVLAAFVPYFMLGALWFTVFFKKTYARSLGKENNLPEKPTPIFIIGPALCTLVITIATAMLMNVLPIENFQDVIVFALTIGIGFLLANTMNIAINPNIPKPIWYGIISGSYHLLGIFVVCIIIFVMQ